MGLRVDGPKGVERCWSEDQLSAMLNVIGIRGRHGYHKEVRYELFGMRQLISGVAYVNGEVFR